MALRKDLITLSYHYEDSAVYHEGDLDVGISSDLDKFIDQYKKSYGGDEGIRDAIFDTIMVELLGRYCRFYATDKTKKLYQEIIDFIKSKLS